MNFIAMGVILIINMFLSACVLKGTYDETLASSVRLADDLKSITKERDTIRMQLETLQKQVAELEARNEELSNTNQVLVGKNTEYARRSLESQKELLQVKEEKAKSRQHVEFVTKTYDDLVAKLKDEIEEGQVRIAQKGNRLAVNMSDQILFPSGSDHIELRGQKVLRKIVDVLKHEKEKQIAVEGHTDNVPISDSLRSRFESNWELSTARATKVLRFLENGGLDPSRLAAIGYGQHHPIASNTTSHGRKQNRRIEIVLTPLPKEGDSRKP